MRDSRTENFLHITSLRARSLNHSLRLKFSGEIFMLSFHFYLLIWNLFVIWFFLPPHIILICTLQLFSYLYDVRCCLFKSCIHAFYVSWHNIISTTSLWCQRRSSKNKFSSLFFPLNVMLLCVFKKLWSIQMKNNERFCRRMEWKIVQFVTNVERKFVDC